MGLKVDHEVYLKESGEGEWFFRYDADREEPDAGRHPAWSGLLIDGAWPALFLDW